MMPVLSQSLSFVLIPLLIFACVAFFVIGAGRGLADRDRIRRRYNALSSVGFVRPVGSVGGWSQLDLSRLGYDRAAQRDLRSTLIRAGYFNPEAVAAFVLVRLTLILVLPAIGLLTLVLVAPSVGLVEKIALCGVLLAIGAVLPKAHLSRRQRHLEVQYRLAFPDFLDMLVVCINAGLGLEAALDRTVRELGPENAALRANFELMAGEMRAGKSTSDALRALSDRLGLKEARAFSGLLLQTIELGTDLAQALITFSDELRDKRMSRAEEAAAALPPKLTLPLGLFIFPVVLIAVLAPAVLKVMSVVSR